MELTTFLEDAKRVKLYQDAKDLFANGDHIKAMEIIEDMILVHKEDKNSWVLYKQQGDMFNDLGAKAENPYFDFAYMLGSVGCMSKDVLLSRPCAHGLYYLAEEFGLVLYYKKCVTVAKQGLSVPFPDDSESFAQAILEELKKDMKEDLESLIKDAESEIADSKTVELKGLLQQDCEPELLDSKKSPAPVSNEFKGLRSFWLGLDVKVKRDFLKVSIAKLISFVKGVHHRPGRDALKRILDSAREDRKWTFWMCRTKCSKKFSSAEECKNHLEQEHAADFKPSLEMNMAKRIGKDWARKISVGSWEPVDTVAAIEMIKNRLADVKAFSYKNGWSKEWPLAADEERSKLLKEIKNLLVMFCDLKILPCNIRDWVKHYSVTHLKNLNVSEQSLVDSHLVDTPQSICFLECHKLSYFLKLLKRIKCERDDGTNLVCRAVDSILGSTRSKEKIDFDPQFSFLLLDRRLLKSNNAPFVDEGEINVFDPNVHYAKAHAQGDDIVSWLTDYNSVEKTFPRPIREHNLDIWVAVLRAVQFTCRTLGTKYAKKVQIFDYFAAFLVAEKLCKSEYERRRNLKEDQWNSYASLLCNRCEEGFPGNFVKTKLFLCAVRDILEEASDVTFDLPDIEGCMNLISELKSLNDDIVLKSLRCLKSVVTFKILLIDSKILLVDNSRISLLKNLTRLSIFDNRTYILQLLKPFLLNEIVNMESKAKSDAAEADLLLEEEKKNSKPSQIQSKKKKNKSKKRTSTSMSSPLSKPGEHLEPDSTSPTVEEDSMEPGDTVNQEEVMKNMPGEDSQSEHLEPALGEVSARYNSALDMTLKALLNIKILKEDLMHNMQPFQHQIPSALQNFFTAFVSEVIKTEGVYSCLLSDLLALLEEVLSMSSGAAEVLVAILEFWHCWKNAERESLVTRLFTLEENERMCCRECRKKPNYPEQSSYGIVMAADSIRDLKRTFGNIEFVDIYKVIRMEYTVCCDIKTGGCGIITNFVHHIISKCPPIFTIVLEWEKSDTEKEISETTNALDWEIDISRLYEGLEPNTNYRLVSMVGCGEEEEHICIAYEKNRWVTLRRDALAGEDVGNWKSVVRFCGERKVRPEILFYEVVRAMA
ncbi:Peptidase C19 ubiquitin carboxyl-terminal hydrolase [Arabidopsis suecica]|uniref:Peptidase C19 ubiquitin carboxyl-terminal hydrolase n=1 Tax=Arabidopsis suecica TaxID=45249 RepID=A0A8T2AEQ5_ARASU|nr:Peptidase C19 ubiquitin carboxyl-terminal hydrolase [Arabidopsis suecica]